MKPATDSPEPRQPANFGWWWESALILLLCYLKAGWWPPEVNEAHYLCKAKHYWNLDWCAGDFFLNSADAHEPFYLLFGWVTLLVSLPTAAWIGRLITWAGLAIAWQRLSWSLTPVRFAAVVSGGGMIVLTTVGHMAGEWILGGVEGKGFAFVLLFLGLEQLVRERWNRCFILLGAASALHVLVGGWAVIAAGVAWLLSGKSRPSLLKIAPGLALGFMFSLGGLVPALLLNLNADADIVRWANYVYTFDRLRHHLIFNQFPYLYIARHVVLIVLLFGLAAFVVRSADAESGQRLRHFRGFAIGAVLLALIGIVIDQCTLRFDDLAAQLLRYYWYRLSDVIVPCGVALFAVHAVAQLWRDKFPPRYAWGMSVLWLAVCVPILWWHWERQRIPLSGSALQTWQQQDIPTTPDQAIAQTADWIALCHWVKENTPRNALFLTPKNQQTFKWYAERAEVFSLKDIPQDAIGIFEWDRRRSDIFAHPVNTLGYTGLSDEELMHLANRYGAKFVIIERAPRVPSFKRIYPAAGEFNESYSIYEIPQP